MDKTLFNSTIPIIITELKHGGASSHVSRQAKSTPITSFQIAPEQGPGQQHTTRGSFDSSLSSSESQESLTTPGPEIVSDAESGMTSEENRAGVGYAC